MIAHMIEFLKQSLALSEISYRLNPIKSYEVLSDFNIGIFVTTMIPKPIKLIRPSRISIMLRASMVNLFSFEFLSGS